MSEHAAGRPEADTSGHPDPGTLACFAEDLLEPAEASWCERHLADCVGCQAALRQVVAASALVSEVLAGDDVGPMPAAVAYRVDLALAAAEAESAPAPVVELAAARSARRRRLTLVAAAASVVAAAVAAVGISTFGAPPTAPHALPSRSPGPRLGAPEPTAPSGGGFSATPRISHTGASYQRDDFDAAVVALLPPTGSASPRAIGPHVDPGASSHPPAPPEALPSCVYAPTHERGLPMVADVGSFDGQPAVVLVYPESGGADRVRGYVVALDCSRVLYQQDVTR